VTAGVRLAVTVIARPRSDPAAALDALRAAGIAEATVVALSAPGAWAEARNAALDAAGDVDVLALLDDDVLVDPGWGGALRDVWGAPDAERLGAVGGPLRATAAPAWLVGDHAEVLALHDGDAASGPFPGGNVAFRVAALRGVGGFFPARGHDASRDTVGEDRRAQRDLEAVGWRRLGVPGLSAARDLSSLHATDLLRRRLHTGARSAALGTDDQAHVGLRGALRLAARSGAAAAARAARGDRGGAVDRAAWAAHGVGAVLGPAVAHGELQPDRDHTTLRADVAAPEPHPWAAAPRAVARRVTRREGQVRGAVLLYHRVATLDTDPLGLAVTPEHFAEQLAALAAGWTTAPLPAVISGDAGPHAVAITFDDGYHDNLLHAVPALAAAGAPATLFASTGHIASGMGYWWDTVNELLGPAAPDEVLAIDLPEGTRAWAPADAAQRAAVRGHLHAALQTRDAATIATAVAALRRWAMGQAERDAAPDGAPPDDVTARNRPLTIAELRELAAAGPFDVQAHGRRHLSLAHAPAASRDDELRGCAADLEDWLHARPTAFSYPFGVPGVNVDAATRDAARAAGYTRGTVNTPGLVRADTDPYAIPRLAVPDVGGDAFAVWLDEQLPGR
jgi:peptidoglycan/xylan/chitin deacetylase (PgdA/CDA1 family)